MLCKRQATTRTGSAAGLAKGAIPAHALSRRQLLQGGLVAGSTALAGCDRLVDPYALPKPDLPGTDGKPLGDERWVTSSCGQCCLACGIRVRVVEGRAVKIEGNPDHPVSRGGIGPRGQAGLDVLYGRSRVRGPLRRQGSRGSGSWRPVSWDSALADIGTALRNLRTAHPERLAVLCGRERGLVADLFSRYCRSFGTPNFIDASRFGAASAVARALFCATGVEEAPSFDLAGASYVLSLDAGLLEASSLRGYVTRGRAQARRGNPGRRSKFVQVGATYSLTAAAADEFLAARPGTLAIFALGVAHVVVKERLYDEEFVGRHTFGLEPWTENDGTRHDGFARLVDRYTPLDVERVTGVAARHIERIAHELAEHRPAVVVADERSTSTSDGLEVARAALALDALLGAIDRPGGVLLPTAPPLRPWPDPEIDDVARRGLGQRRADADALDRHPMAISVPEDIYTSLASGRPSAPEALLVYYANPIGSSAQPGAVRSALGKLSLLVSFSPYLDETAAFADYVLPDHTYLERWEDSGTPSATGYPIFGLRQPVVPPVHDTRNAGDVILGLARSAGGMVAASFPWSDFETLLKERVAGLRASGRGTIQAESDDEFFDKLVAAGVWADPPYRSERWDSFHTPSGGFEFFSQTALAAYRRRAAAGPPLADVLAVSGAPQALDEACLGAPSVARFVGAPDQYPLIFIPYQAGNEPLSGPSVPHLAELGVLLTGVRWGSRVELNPRAAAAAGIREGDEVWVESPVGRLHTRARLHEGIPLHVARMALGRPPDPDGHGTAVSDGEPRDILPSDNRSQLGRPALAGVRVRVTRVAS